MNLQLLSAEAENEITVCAFRLLTMDMLVLYGVMNEGTINVLGRDHPGQGSGYRFDLIYRALLRDVEIRRREGTRHLQNLHQADKYGSRISEHSKAIRERHAS